MKSLILITSLFISSTILAQSNKSLSDKAARVADSLQSIEDQLSSQDRKALRDSLDFALQILSSYDNIPGNFPGNGGGRNFICVSNGQSGSWERFYVMDLQKNQKIGGETSKAQCHESISKSNSTFICASNGQSGSWERFSIYNSRTGSNLGGETSFEKCAQATNSSRNGLVCSSNGQSGSWERFSIYDFKEGTKLGGETSFESCGALTKRSTRNLVCVSNGQSGSWERFQLINRTNNSTIGGETSLENCLETIH